MPVLTFQGKKVHIMIVPYLSYTLDLWAESSWVLDVWVCQGGPQFSLPLRAMPETIGSWLRQCGCRLLQHNGPTALRRSASSFHGAPTHTSCLLCFASSGQPAVRSSECMPLHPLLHRGVPSVLVEQLGRGARVECSSHPKCCWPIVTSRCDQLLCLIQRERVAPSKRSGCPLEWPLAPPPPPKKVFLVSRTYLRPSYVNGWWLLPVLGGLLSSAKTAGHLTPPRFT